MIGKLITAGALVAAMTAPALADPIEGAWKTQAGDNAMISSCGGSFCIKLTSGEYAGTSIGKMKATSSGNYAGSITKPSNGKTYSGSGKLSGSKLKMTGCVLKILCESQTWNKL
ncbi:MULTISPECIES: DUF2147 domain-containing protein [unclassified Hoeflea]|uniref:DUF2147 domain-containing protein n=1 Tax=unclassified Hoeflea TaxID=2614931 RepID=UPI002AFEA381|nr:DUF2147 domain-containing protein [Hoeflea sp.]